eukprot:64020-Chlamydomonas_euryale.AAC.3
MSTLLLPHTSTSPHLVEVLVDVRLILDVLCAVCKFECGQRLLERLHARRNRADHGGAAVAAQAVLEDARQLAVRVWGVCECGQCGGGGRCGEREALARLASAGR